VTVEFLQYGSSCIGVNTCVDSTDSVTAVCRYPRELDEEMAV